MRDIFEDYHWSLKKPGRGSTGATAINSIPGCLLRDPQGSLSWFRANSQYPPDQALNIFRFDIPDRTLGQDHHLNPPRREGVDSLHCSSYIPTSYWGHGNAPTLPHHLRGEGSPQARIIISTLQSLVNGVSYNPGKRCRYSSECSCGKSRATSARNGTSTLTVFSCFVARIRSATRSSSCPGRGLTSRWSGVIVCMVRSLCRYMLCSPLSP